MGFFSSCGLARFVRKDLELLDREADPHEVPNLAVGPEANNDVVLAMDAKFNAPIDSEVGMDPGGMIPERSKGGWEVSAETTKGC